MVTHLHCQGLDCVQAVNFFFHQCFLSVSNDLLSVCSIGVALFCSFLLGLGDSCFNTQLLSIIGFLFKDNSAPAFAVFKFIQVSPSQLFNEI